MKSLLFFSVVLASLELFAADKTGISEKEIVIGSSGTTSGPIGIFGSALVTGMRAAIDKTNEAGGVHGRKIKLIVTDDAYDPQNAMKNVATLVNADNAFVLMGSTNSSGIAASLPIISDKKVPLLFPYGAADFMFDPVKPMIFNLRPSFDQEGQALASQMVKLKFKKFAIFYQDDAFGRSVQGSFVKAVKNAGGSISVSASHQRNEMAFDKAVAEMKAGKPEVIFLATNATPAVAFIKQALAAGVKAVYAGNSVVAPGNIAQSLASEKKLTVYVSDAWPSSAKTSVPIVTEFNQSSAVPSDKKLTPYVFFGFMAAKLLVQTLNAIGPDLSREKLISALESMKDLDLGGLKINYSPSKHQGLEKVYLYKFADGELKEI